MTTNRTDYSALAWEKRVAELEAEGATTSDAQAVADAEFINSAPWGFTYDELAWEASTGAKRL